MSVGVMELEVRSVFAYGMCWEGNIQNLIKSSYRGFSVDLPSAKEVGQIHLFSKYLFTMHCVRYLRPFLVY